MTIDIIIEQLELVTFNDYHNIDVSDNDTYQVESDIYATTINEEVDNHAITNLINNYTVKSTII